MNLWFNPILWEYKFLRPDLLWLLIPVWLIYLWMIIPKRRNNTFAVLTTTAYIDKETSEQFLLFKNSIGLVTFWLLLYLWWLFLGLYSPILMAD